MYDKSQLEEMLLPDLRDLAKSLNIRKSDSLKKQELVYQILDHQAANPPQDMLEAEKMIHESERDKHRKRIPREAMKKPAAGESADGQRRGRKPGQPAQDNRQPKPDTKPDTKPSSVPEPPKEAPAQPKVSTPELFPAAPPKEATQPLPPAPAEKRPMPVSNAPVRIRSTGGGKSVKN